MIVKHVKIWLCEACLDGNGEVCHTPRCALCRNRSPDIPVHPELYSVLAEVDDKADRFK